MGKIEKQSATQGGKKSSAYETLCLVVHFVEQSAT